MSPHQIGPVRRAWYKWKALRLPWRKQFLIGLDLQGNTYWEFLDQRLGTPPPGDAAAAAAAAAAQRWRRIVRPANASAPYADLRVPPQWHQWLRHTRPDPPSLDEQARDVARLEQLKVLAAAADARWAAKESLVDAPPAAAGPAAVPAPPGAVRGGAAAEGARSVRTAQRAQRREQAADVEDPWKRPQPSGPSERWQPKGWEPSSPSRRE